MSEHFSSYKYLFETYNELKNPIEIFISKKRIIIYDIEQGRISLKIIAKSIINEISINIIYTLDMKSNLLFISMLLEKNYEISMKSYSSMKILKNDILITNIVKEGKLIQLKIIQYLATKTTAGKKKEKHIKTEGIHV